MTTNNQKPDYHLNNGNEPQKVDKETQQFQGGDVSPKQGETVAAKGEDLKIGKHVPSFGDFSNFDWETELKSNAIATTKYYDIARANSKQIADAEKSMGDKAQALYQAYGEQAELDASKLASATPEQLAELEEALKKSHEIVDLQAQRNAKSKAIDEELDELYKHGSLLGGIWKGKYHVDLAEYPQLEASIPAKKEWLEANQPFGFETKIKALDEFKEKHDRWMELQKEKQSVSGDFENEKGTLTEAQKTIAKFQDPLDMYSSARKNKAVWCQSMAQSKKEFEPDAKKQRSLMTDDERYALSQYTGQGSSTINKPLRGLSWSSGWGSGPQVKKKALAECKKMTAALDKCPSTKDAWLQRGCQQMNFGGVKLHAGMSNEELQAYIGQEYIDGGFMSCGAAKGTGFTSQPVMLNIYCPKGTKMHYVASESQYKNENEMIIQRGYHYRIAKIMKSNYTLYVDVDVIVGSDADKLTEKQMEKLYDKYL